MILRTLPEGMTAVSSLVEGIAARLAAVSLSAASRLSAQGAEREISGATGVAELSGSSLGVAESGASYLEGDLAAASVYFPEIG
jgi:hypothetical protein